jgi:protein involved in ribonucleotide reduction
MSVVGCRIVLSRKEKLMAKHYVIMEYTNAKGETKTEAMRSVDIAEFLTKYPNAKRVYG